MPVEGRCGEACQGTVGRVDAHETALAPHHARRFEFREIGLRHRAAMSLGDGGEIGLEPGHQRLAMIAPRKASSDVISTPRATGSSPLARAAIHSRTPFGYMQNKVSVREIEDAPMPIRVCAVSVV